jgi:hypothetical protein
LIIPFELSHEFSEGSSPEENAFALKVLLDALVKLDIGYLRNHRDVPPLYASGVVYERTKNWLTIKSMYELGYGDCKSLVAAICAERFVRQGIECRTVFRDLRRPDGLTDFHILVMLPDGSFEDPSKVCGMAAYQRRHQSSRE